MYDRKEIQDKYKSVFVVTVFLSFFLSFFAMRENKSFFRFV